MRLVGREAELKRLDEAWTDCTINIISLIAEGGAGKSALVNEWFVRLQADSYRGAEAVLGWSFYSQGSKERATSADQFLDWALNKLGIETDTTSAYAKGETLADEMSQRRVLLVLDGVEPLQHGPGGQQGELKGAGLRGLLRRLATLPPRKDHGLVVLTSRLAVKNIARWKDSAAPVIDLEELSEEAGAQLLRDNKVQGTDDELKATASDFGGHPLALGLLASFLNETQFGDVRRRDHIRTYWADTENPRHDHARRVMESYEKEWLASRPVEHAILRIVGLFDRPADRDCLLALRAKPAIEGLTHLILGLDDIAWRRAIARLRDARLLSPLDRSAPDSIDAHPLVREWFGEQLEQTNPLAWKAAHGRLYEHLRDTTEEGEAPDLSALAPLYQAIAHGCRAARYQEALDDVYQDRICRRDAYGKIKFYATRTLGAFGSNIAALYWFFERPYEVPISKLGEADGDWVLSEAGFNLRSQGRFAQALAAWRRASSDVATLTNVSLTELIVGDIAAAMAAAQRSVDVADARASGVDRIIARTMYAHTLHAAGRGNEAASVFDKAEGLFGYRLFSTSGYFYCDLLLANGEHVEARERARETIGKAHERNLPCDTALDMLTVARADHGLALRGQAKTLPRLDDVVERLRAYGDPAYIATSFLARAALCRSFGDWGGGRRDLDEVEQIAEVEPMMLHWCDIALERARLAMAQIEAFAPLNGLIEGRPPKPKKPNKVQRKTLRGEAAKQLAVAADYIEKCGYHRRDEELAELQAVLKGERKYADLPPRV